MGAQPSETPALRRPGSWSSWGRDRRRLVVLKVLNWILMAALTVIAIVLQDVRIMLPIVVLLPLDWWIGDRLRENEYDEYAEGALASLDDAPTTAEEQELLDELDASGSDREANLLIAREWLAGNELLRRYEYPTRELLVVRSASEAVEMLGLAIVALGAPAVTPTAVGAMLWLLGGRAGASLARAVLGERLRRTPIDDETRERWLRRERMAIFAFGAPVVAVAAIRFLT